MNVSSIVCQLIIIIMPIKYCGLVILPHINLICSNQSNHIIIIIMSNCIGI